MANHSKFNDSIKLIILKLATKGQTDEQIADTIGVCRTTLANWKVRYPGFAKKLLEAKSVADELVEASLFSRAVGYSHPETKVFCTKEGEIVRATIRKRYPPDTVACIFWLKNRMPELYRDRVEQVVEERKPIVLKYNLEVKKGAA